MGWKRKAQGGVLGFIGFMLSPLSWWNDAFVNLPIAVGFAWIVAYFHAPAFTPAVIVGYWLTNVVGLVLLHKGAQRAIREDDKPYTRRDLAKDFAISVAYTLVIVALVWLGLLRPLEKYFPEN